MAPEQLRLSPETLDLILQTLDRMAQSEEQRFREVDTKSGLLVGFCGSLLAVVGAVGGRYVVDPAAPLWANLTSVALGVFSPAFCLVCGLWQGWRSLASVEWRLVSPDDLVSRQQFVRHPASVKLHVARAWATALSENARRIDRKLSRFDSAGGWVRRALVLLVVSWPLLMLLHGHLAGRI